MRYLRGLQIEATRRFTVVVVALNSHGRETAPFRPETGEVTSRVSANTAPSEITQQRRYRSVHGVASPRRSGTYLRIGAGGPVGRLPAESTPVRWHPSRRRRTFVRPWDDL